MLTINKIDLITTNPDYLSDISTSHIFCSAKTGEGMLDILEAIASYKKEAEAEVPSSRRNERIKDENLTDSDENENIDSIIKEFQGKF
ncbi:MAG: hypothetical protein ACFFAE_09660 [Candidatus Hodarchaeota archaeon]